MLRVVTDEQAGADLASSLDEIVREGARRILAAALEVEVEVEVEAYVLAFVDETTGERCRFRSSIIPPWARKSPKVAEVLPLMYLHGMSSKDFAPALEDFFGSSAGLSPSVITRLTTQWQEERDRFSRRSLADVDYVYVWADGIHFNALPKSAQPAARKAIAEIRDAEDRERALAAIKALEWDYGAK